MPLLYVPCLWLVNFQWWSFAALISTTEGAFREGPERWKLLWTEYPVDLAVMLNALSAIESGIIKNVWDSGAHYVVLVPLYVQLACASVQLTITRIAREDRLDAAQGQHHSRFSTMEEVKWDGAVDQGTKQHLGEDQEVF